MKRLVVLGLSLLMVACSGEQTTVARRAKPSAVVGGTLSIGIEQPRSIDPAHAGDRWSRFVAGLICDPLIQLDPVTGELVPAIAESWIVSGGGTSITLKLRKDVRFHDGSALTADDVVAALTRAASQEEASTIADLLQPIAGWAKVHGDEESRNEEETSRLTGVSAIGTHAVQITLAVPRADFVRVLAHPIASPVARAAVSKDPAAFGAQPVCAGPYRVTSAWTPADPVISLARFEGYYGGNAGFTRGGAGYADRIELRIGAREADVVPSARGSIVAPTPYLEYIALPVDAPPFNDRDVRVALSAALDRAAIAREVYGGARAPAHGFLPPALGRFHRARACGAPASGAVADARRVLRDFSLTYNPDFENAALAEAVAGQWERAFGISVEVTAMPFDGLLARATSTAGFDEPFRMGWEPPYVGPDAMLAPLFASGSIGTDNVARFADPRFDRELERKARRASVDEDLRASYHRLEDILCEQVPVIPVVFGGARYAVERARIDSAVETFTDIASGTPLVRELYVRT